MSYPPQGPPGGYPPQGPPPGGYPPQGPPPGGYPPQGPPPGGYPQGPVGGYPQGGMPEQGFPQQGAFSSPQQGGGGPGGYPPTGYGGGYGAPPPKQGPNVILVVAVGIVALSLVGVLLFMFFGRGNDQAGPTTDPTTGPTTSTTQPDPDPTTTQPDPDPTTTQPDPDPSTTTTQPDPDPSTTSPGPGPSGGEIAVALGIKLTPAAGWSVRSQQEGNVVLHDGAGNVFSGQAAQLAAGTSAQALVTSYLRSQAEKMTNAKFTEPKAINKHASLDVYQAAVSGTVTGSQGSQNIGITAVISIRKSDGLMVAAVIWYPMGGDVQSLNAPYNSMLNSMLRGQIQ